MSLMIHRSNYVENNITLLDNFFDAFLNSGLLLDEDLEILVAHCTFNNNHDQGSCTSTVFWYLGVGIGCTLAALYMLKQPSFSLLSHHANISIASVPAVLTSYKLYDIWNKRKQFQVPKRLVECLKKIIQMNQMILMYLKRRKTIFSDSDNLFVCFPNKIIMLMDVVLENEKNVLLYMLYIINNCQNRIKALKLHYSLVDVDYFEQFQIKYVTDLDASIKTHELLSDVFVLFVSHCLSCLSFTISTNMWTKDVAANEMLNTSPGHLLKLAERCLANLTQQFNETKECVTNFNRDVLKKRMKLDEIVTKFFHAIVKNFQKIDLKNKSQRKELGRSLEELQIEIIKFHESLDILQKLCMLDSNIAGIIKSPQSQDQSDVSSEIEKPPNFPLTEEDLELDLNKAFIDEEYEMSGERDDDIQEIPLNFDDYDAESRNLSSLLTKELKHELLSHGRFIEARQKRGIGDETMPDFMASGTSSTVSGTSLTVSETSSKVSGTASTDQIGISPLSSPPPPPPPPPPLILFDKSSVESVEVEATESELASAIKMASTTRKEDIFE